MALFRKEKAQIPSRSIECILVNIHSTLYENVAVVS
jgi:hypothetical protein